MKELEFALQRQNFEYEQRLKEGNNLNGVKKKMSDVLVKIFLVLMQKFEVGDKEIDQHLEVYMNGNFSLEKMILKADALVDEEMFNK